MKLLRRLGIFCLWFMAIVASWELTYIIAKLVSQLSGEEAFGIAVGLGVVGGAICTGALHGTDNKK